MHAVKSHLIGTWCTRNCRFYESI